MEPSLKTLFQTVKEGPYLFLHYSTEFHGIMFFWQNDLKMKIQIAFFERNSLLDNNQNKKPIDLFNSALLP